MDLPRKRRRQDSDGGASSRAFPRPLSPPLPQTSLPDGAHTVDGHNAEGTVCYGMVAGFHGTYTRLPVSSGVRKESDVFAVTIESSHKFTPANISDASSCGKFSSDYIDIVQALLDEPSLRLQASCTVGSPQPQKATAKPARLGPLSQPCELSIIVYGPRGLLDNVGEFFQYLEIYLQDPKDCEWDMIPGESDLLDVLDASQDLPEADQPQVILPFLKKHQRQALTFLQQREAGWDFDPRSDDFWDFRQTSQEAFITLTCYADAPPQFCGGIVADPMGLGKTLTMIALIAADKQSVPSSSPPSLILVPPPLLDTWEEQLGQHVRQGGLTWRRHYGKDKLTEADNIATYDIIISTYNTVSADWNNEQKATKSVLFSTPWKRIVLDEAHVIRNAQSQMSRAVCALNATARWAVTGTPIQNKIGDLAALLMFIRAYPYDNVKHFESDIGQMWKTGNIEEAVNRLRKLSRGLILRRPKTVIELPPRTDLKFPIDFSPSERALYEKLKQQTIAGIEEAFRDGDSGGLASNSYITVMQRINALRMICDLGLNYDSRHDVAAAEEARNSDLKHWSAVAQETFNLHREVHSVECSICEYVCHTAATPFIYGTIEPSPPSYFAKCLSYICSDCAQRRLGQSEAVVCEHTPSHSIAPVSLSWATSEDNGAPTGSGTASVSSTQLSSKVTALISHLKWLPVDTKSVVFSSWRMSLNLVEVGLKQAQIKYIRFDGKVRQQDRQTVIEKFRKDPTLRVFLLTLSCGAVGLTLTEASQAYLMEPHWNPTIEEQALARVYRLGQQKPIPDKSNITRGSWISNDQSGNSRKCSWPREEELKIRTKA
ncbi:SNF2 family N-terminal domain-containing protein [Lasiosphaeria ovina]|uniref:SNF2 family N-terminal domain-containing protein n=1 Tax=Lasiosphaeria ovina TaxID=92902 RepID=A0AAE0K3J4_9PEZI|nr:SNF2 family N-terminal domain-containing protein [Lasiosphaeria ovina]